MTESADRRPDAEEDAARTAPGPLARLVGRLGSVFSANGDTSLRKSLEGVIEQHDTADEGLSAEERSMLLNILEFGKLRVDDVMVPRADIVAVDQTISIGELVSIFKSAAHSRLPVYRETLDDPIGMVHIKDMLSWIVAAGAGRKAKRAAKAASTAKPGDSVDLSRADLSTRLSEARIGRDILFVPPSMLAMDLLVKMQTSRIHMAIVVDEYGGTDGLASIEDLVEVIVGDIEDEHDIDGAPMIVANEFGYDADARLPIEDLDKILGLELVPADREEDVDTLGGLVFTIVGRVPVRGELIRHEAGVEFEVLEGDPRRLKKVRIHLAPRGADGPAPAPAARRRNPEPDARSEADAESEPKAEPAPTAPGNETSSVQ